MDELSEKLAEILNDPESMNAVKQMAESLLGGEKKVGTEKEEKGIAGADMQMMMGILSRLKNQGDDSRTQLLSALKPHLSEPRQEKVNTAIKILKLIDILPLIKESGILGQII